MGLNEFNMGLIMNYWVTISKVFISFFMIPNAIIRFMFRISKRLKGKNVHTEKLRH